MRLRNRKTGQEGNFIINKDHFECVDLDCVPFYFSLSELLNEWEDATSTIWYITHDGSIYSADIGNSWTREKTIGNYFETREEAEKAVKKLKAWKRLKDSGLKFKDLNKSNYDKTFCINAEIEHDVTAFEFFKDLRVALDMEINDEAQK